MNAETKQRCTEHRNLAMDEELADVLSAISVVSRRLARKLKMLSEQNKADPEYCKEDGRDRKSLRK